jgi:hypothetical protein
VKFCLQPVSATSIFKNAMPMIGVACSGYGSPPGVSGGAFFVIRAAGLPHHGQADDDPALFQ